MIDPYGPSQAWAIRPAHGLFGAVVNRSRRRNIGAKGFRAVARKPDGNDGVHTMYWQEDSTADLWHTPARQATYCLIGGQI